MNIYFQILPNENENNKHMYNYVAKITEKNLNYYLPEIMYLIFPE